MLGDNVQFRFPVQREVDGRIGEFVVQADHAGGAEPGLAAFKPDIGTPAVKPGKAGVEPIS